MNSHWGTKKKVGNCATTDEPQVNETPMKLENRRAKKKNHSLKKVQKLFDNLGSQLESLIDSSILGVPDPQPWSPQTDKKAAALCKPVQSTVDFMNQIYHSMDKIVALPSIECGATPFAAFVLASQKVLLRVREGLANAIREEEAVVAAPAGEDLDLTEEGGFVDLGKREEEGAKSNSAKKVVVDFAKNTVLPLLDNLAVQISSPDGEDIIVTSDDCSVASYAELSDNEFEDCPSVFTECPPIGDDAEAITKEDIPQVIKEDLNVTQDVTLDDDDDEYVIADQPPSDSDDEDFVDVRADFDIAYCP